MTREPDDYRGDRASRPEHNTAIFDARVHVLGKGQRVDGQEPNAGESGSVSCFP